MTKHMILFLAANPVGTDRLALDKEARAIHVGLRGGDDARPRRPPTPATAGSSQA